MPPRAPRHNSQIGLDGALRRAAVATMARGARAIARARRQGFGTRNFRFRPKYCPLPPPTALRSMIRTKPFIHRPQKTLPRRFPPKITPSSTDAGGELNFHTTCGPFALARPESGIRFLLRPFLHWGRMVHSVGTDSRSRVNGFTAGNTRYSLAPYHLTVAVAGLILTEFAS